MCLLRACMQFHQVSIYLSSSQELRSACYFVYPQVEQDLADFTFFGYSCTLERLRVANCLTNKWNHRKMYTQYPMEASKFWNLLNLFTTESWSWIGGTLSIVILSLKLSTYVGKKLGIPTQSEEIILVPYRFVTFILFTIS